MAFPTDRLQDGLVYKDYRYNSTLGAWEKTPQGGGQIVTAEGGSYIDLGSGNYFEFSMVDHEINGIPATNLNLYYYYPRRDTQVILKINHDNTRDCTCTFQSAFWKDYSGPQQGGPGGQPYSLPSGVSYTYFYIFYDGANYFIQDVKYWAPEAPSITISILNSSEGTESFSPQATLSSGYTLGDNASISWEIDGTTSDILVPTTLSYTGIGTFVAQLRVTPWAALESLNLGYGGEDGGSISIPHVVDQHVTAISGLEAATNLTTLCLSYSQITSLDLHLMTALTTLEVYLGSLTSVVPPPNVQRLCLEGNAITGTLNLASCTALTDLRAALNLYTTLTLPTTAPDLWHICVRNNANLVNPESDFSRFTSLQDILIWSSNYSGVLTLPDSAYNIIAYGNAFTSVVFAGTDVHQLNLTGNALTDTDSIINTVAANLITGGTLYLAEGTNANATAASATARSTLAAAGWTTGYNGLGDLNWWDGLPVFENFEDETLVSGFSETDTGNVLTISQASQVHDGSGAMAVNLTGKTTQAFISYAPNATAFSLGFWYRTASNIEPFGQGPVIVHAERYATAELFRIRDERNAGTNARQLYSDYFITQIPVTDATWYFITFRATRNGPLEYVVYNSNLTAVVGSGTSIINLPDYQCDLLQIGDYESNAFPTTIYFDSLGLDNSASPVFPMNSIGFTENFEDSTLTSNLTATNPDSALVYPSIEWWSYYDDASLKIDLNNITQVNRIVAQGMPSSFSLAVAAELAAFPDGQDSLVRFLATGNGSIEDVRFFNGYTDSTNTHFLRVFIYGTSTDIPVSSGQDIVIAMSYISQGAVQVNVYTESGDLLQSIDGTTNTEPVTYLAVGALEDTTAVNATLYLDQLTVVSGTTAHPIILFDTEGAPILLNIGVEGQTHTFAPVIELNDGYTLGDNATVIWGFDDSTTSTSLTPSYEYTGLENVSLVVIPWTAIKTLDLGYDASDGGSLSIPLVPNQYVNSLANIFYAPALTTLCLSYSPITTIPGIGKSTSLTTLEAFEAGLTSIVPPVSIERFCIEGCAVTSLDMSKCSALRDLRAAAMGLTSLNFGSTSFPNLTHICVRQNSLTSLRTTNFPALQELWIWNNPGLTGTLTVDSNVIDSVYANACGYTVLDMSEVSTTRVFIKVGMEGTPITSVLLGSNSFEQLDFTGCSSLTTLDLTGQTHILRFDATNGALTSATVEHVLHILDEAGITSTTPGVFDGVSVDLIGGTNAYLTAAAQVHADNLATKGWVVTYNTNTDSGDDSGDPPVSRDFTEDMEDATPAGNATIVDPASLLIMPSTDFHHTGLASMRVNLNGIAAPHYYEYPLTSGTFAAGFAYKAAVFPAGEYYARIAGIGNVGTGSGYETRIMDQSSDYRRFTAWIYGTTYVLCDIVNGQEVRFAISVTQDSTQIISVYNLADNTLLGTVSAARPDMGAATYFRLGVLDPVVTSVNTSIYFDQFELNYGTTSHPILV